MNTVIIIAVVFFGYQALTRFIGGPTKHDDGELLFKYDEEEEGE
jgi:hypothetical protein